MTIGLASLIFQIYMDPQFKSTGLLNDLLHRIRTVYISKNHRNSDIFVYEDIANLVVKMDNISLE